MYLMQDDDRNLYQFDPLIALLKNISYTWNSIISNYSCSTEYSGLLISLRTDAVQK